MLHFKFQHNRTKNEEFYIFVGGGRGASQGPLPSLPPIPLRKAKFFIYGAILLKFEIEYFHMFTNNNLY